MKKYYLYKKESPLGLKYLGVTSHKNPYTYDGSGIYWNNHIKFHNFSCIDIATDILLETSDKKELCFWGMYYSKIWNIVKSEEWANLVIEDGNLGFSGYKHSELTLEKMSNVSKGVKKSDKHKENIRLSKLGKPSGNKGFKHSEESKNNMSKSRIGKYKGKNNPRFGKKLSRELIDKQIKAQKEYWKNNKEQKDRITLKLCKAVQKFDLNGNFIEEYISAKEASIKNGLKNYSPISNACNGVTKTCRKFIWKWKK